MLNELWGAALDLADLEAHLAYKPWIEENREAYSQDISRGLIPALQNTATWFSQQAIIHGRSDADRIILTSTFSGGSPDFPAHLLYSQWSKEILDQITFETSATGGE